MAACALVYVLAASTDHVGTILPLFDALQGHPQFADDLLLGVVLAAALGLYWALRRSTEMRALATELAWSRDMAAAGFDQSPHATFVIDVATMHFLAVNDAAVSLYGWSREEFLGGMHALDLLPEERRATVREASTTVAPGERIVVVGENVRRDGSRLWVEVAHSGITLGDRPAVVTVANDITARIEAEAQKREAEKRFRAIFDTEAVGILEVDAKSGLIITANEAFARIVGRSRDKLAGVAVLQITHPDDIDGSRQLLSVLRTHQRPAFSTIKRFVRPDGSSRTAAVAAAHVPHDDEEPARNIAVVVDVTDRTEAEAEASRLAERLSLTLDVIGEGTFDWDIATDAWQASSALARMLGMQPGAMPASMPAWRSRIHPEDAARFDAAVGAHLSGQSPSLEVQHRLQAADGRYLWVDVRGQVVKRETDGRALRVLGSVTDITAHRELEEQLRQSQKMEAVGQLAGGIAHDFNNLLTVIRTGLEMVLSENLSPDTRADLSEVELATQRASNLTSQLLAFSRRRLAQPQLMSLNESVDELAKLLRRVLTEDVEVRRRLQSRTYIMADPGHVGQALLNIAVNARDAMSAGGVLTISTYDAHVEAGSPDAHDGVKPGRYSVVSLGDTGHGMTTDVRERIFEPFFTTKPLGKGTGLGLASVYGIVKQASGFARVESAPGAGTTFYLYFPAAASKPPMDTPAKDDDLPGGTETVLVVEDDAPVRLVATRLLSSHGYRVLQAADGAAALALLGQEPRVDLVLSDIVMPNMTGGRLAAEGQRLFPRTAFIVMSAHAPDTLSQYAVPEDMTVLTKPFTSASLLTAVRRAIDERRQTVS